MQVNAELDFNRITQTSDTFDPESRVVRSTQTREESQVSTDANNGQVSVANEVPNPAAQGAATPVRDQSKKSEETINYEISNTTRTEVVEGGRIKRLSVAVVVDGTYARDGAGNVSYTPRTKEEIDRITALVRSAIGFDEKRGDQVEVVNLRFAEGPPPGLPADEGWLSQLKFGKDDMMQAAETRRLPLPDADRAADGGAADGPPHPRQRRGQGAGGGSSAERDRAAPRIGLAAAVAGGAEGKRHRAAGSPTPRSRVSSTPSRSPRSASWLTRTRRKPSASFANGCSRTPRHDIACQDH